MLPVEHRVEGGVERLALLLVAAGFPDDDGVEVIVRQDRVVWLLLLLGRSRRGVRGRVGGGGAELLHEGVVVREERGAEAPVEV